MEFSPLSVIAGANASGKSNLFDALNLLSNLAETDIRTAFNKQRGEAQEQFSIFSNKHVSDEISFVVELLVDKKVKDNWGGEETLKYTRLRYELTIKRVKNSKGVEDFFITKEYLGTIRHDNDKWVIKYIPKGKLDFWRPKVKSGRRGIPYIRTENKTIKVPLDGKPGVGKEFPAEAISQTVLSGINSVEFPHVFAAKEEIRSWNFLQLNPEDLREPSLRTASDIIEPSGANLASSLYRIKVDDRSILNDISRQLNNLLPNFIKVDVEEDLASNKFVIKVFSEDKREFSSRVLSEGTLRLLTLCILKFDIKHKGILCFEEPENGIHPYRLRMMFELLQDLTTDFNDTEEPYLSLRQVIINTHSPILINELFKPQTSNANISIWFSQLVTQIINSGIDDKTKSKFQATKILPVILPVNLRNKNYQFDFVSDTETAFTLNEVIRYLTLADFEGTKKLISGE
jgi:predicted ATPase